MLKNTTPVICAMALAMALLSCAREVLEPGQMITGKYAPDDGSGLASEYISFDGGELGLYRSQSDVLFTFAENKFWDCSKSTFLTTIGYRYSIQSGMMSSGFYSGPAELTGDKLKLGSKTYTRLDGFEQEKYSSIEVESELTVPYNSGGTFTPLSISRPIAAGKISASASSSSSWITGVKVEDGELRFNYSETKNPRDGYITITYTNAQSRTIMVHQRPSTYIVLPSAANTVDYTGKSVSIPYSITGPVAGSSISAKCTATWVKNISVTSSAVECTVDENTGNTSRKATFTLSYSGAADVTYVLTQDWASTSITTSPGALSCDHTGGSFSFGVNVQNPRSGVVVIATSKADWITNVALTDDEVSFKVAENNTSSVRTGEIELKYGSFSSYNFKVTQGWGTTVVLTPSSAEVSYTGGVGTFNYEVRNPRSGISVTAASQVVWITDVSVTGDRVTYTVGENNSAVSRTGKIKLTYSSYASAEYFVAQFSQPVQSLSLDKTSLSLRPGDAETLVATVDPSDAVLSWTSSNSAVATVSTTGKVTAVGNGNAVITASATDGSGKKATCSVVVRDPCPTGAVDLGLSVYWATCNLGTSGFVSSPEKYGEYYAWGETATKSSYNWSTYKWCNGSSTTLTKYNNSSSYGTVDNKTVLDLADDVAHEKLGGNWRMPTDAEWTELRTKCTWTWTTNYNGTGVTGRIVTASNGNSIFLPAAGCGDRTNLSCGAGSYGSYWSSSLGTVEPGSGYARGLEFNSDRVYKVSANRYYGFSVRPVSE